MVQGTGHPMAVTTCAPGITNFNTDISIITNCDNATQCVDTSLTNFLTNSELACPQDVNDYYAAYAWHSVLNQIYYIFVAGVQRLHTGTFGLTVLDFAPLANDQCTSAQSVRTDGTVVIGSTIDGGNSSWCSQLSGNFVGNWYTFTGTGNDMMISTCHNATDYASDMSIVASSNCTAATSGSLTCAHEASLDYTEPCDYPEFGQVYIIPTIQGQDYLVFVSGLQPNDIGTYGFSVTDLVPPANSFCETNGPIPLIVNGPIVTGLTVAANASIYCGDVTTAGLFPGLWYSAVGTGNTMSISTCTQATDYATDITIQTSCLSTCIKASRAICGNSQGQGVAYSWKSVAGQEYFFYVNGALQSDVGNFGVFVQDGVVSTARVDACTTLVLSVCTSCHQYQHCVRQTVRQQCTLAITQSTWRQEKSQATQSALNMLKTQCKKRKSHRQERQVRN